MPSSVALRAPAAQVQHVDLGAAPLKSSRILAEFTAGRAVLRAQQAAQRAESERLAEMAEFRRIGGGRRARPAQGAAQRAAQQVPAGNAFAAKAFEAGQTDRLTAGWLAINSSINADLEASLATIRARSRAWTMNTDAGARYLELVADNVVGPNAPRLQVRVLKANGRDLDEALNTAVEHAWHDWQQECDVARVMDFTAICRAVVQCCARDGEYLLKRIADRSLLNGLALQLLDVDRIDIGASQWRTSDGGSVRLGVSLDPLGRKRGLMLFPAHPGDIGGHGVGASSALAPASEVLHGFVHLRPEQVRGCPWTAPILRRANMLAKYEEYAMVAAKFGAAKMGFYTVDKDAADQAMTLEQLRDATGELVQEVEAGMLEALPPGVDFKSFDPDYPHANYAPFVNASKRDMAVGLNVAHHNLSGDMTGVNYSSARIAELSERRHWRVLQRWLINSFVRPVFEQWLQLATLRGDIKLPRGRVLDPTRWQEICRAATFQPPGWAWVDPEADIKAAALAATYDIRSLRQVTDEQGVDLEETLADKAQLLAQYQQRGLPVPPWLSGGAPVWASGSVPGVSNPPAATGGGSGEAAPASGDAGSQEGAST